METFDVLLFYVSLFLMVKFNKVIRDIWKHGERGGGGRKREGGRKEERKLALIDQNRFN